MNLSFDFTGRTVLITGAARGIGLEIAKTFSGAGARVVAVDNNADNLRAAWGDGSDTVLTAVLDVADGAGADALLERIAGWSGALDILVNNAGITRDTVLWKMTDQQWNEVIAVHLTGTFNLTRAAVPLMRKAGRGRIINVTSYTGLHGNFGQANYAAAKAGIVGFTKSVAKELAGFGITVNAISPNAETALVAAIPPDRKAELLKVIPLGRFGEPSEMTAAVAFLASDEAAFITGVVLPVDGGAAI
jgi:3-oxoacyl-[acyl-carrier protein] reductase